MRMRYNDVDKPLGHRSLDLAQLPGHGRAEFVGEDFMVADNLESSEPFTDFVFAPGSVVQLASPFKIRFSMMLICFGGSMKLRLGMKEYILEKGNLLVSVSGMVGECLEIARDAKLGMIAFSDGLIGSGVTPDRATMFRENAAIFRENYIGSPLVRLSEADFDDVGKIYMMLRRRLGLQGFGMKRQLVYASIGLIFCYVSGSLSVSDMHVKRVLSRKEQIFEDFLKLVENYCSSRHDVSFYADKLCLTPKYLSTTILEVSGKYASEWIRDNVVFEAKALLNSRRYTVQQISEQLGFANQSHFGVYFKRVAGCSPKAYMSGVSPLQGSGE